MSNGVLPVPDPTSPGEFDSDWNFPDFDFRETTGTKGAEVDSSGSPSRVKTHGEMNPSEETKVRQIVLPLVSIPLDRTT